MDSNHRPILYPSFAVSYTIIGRIYLPTELQPRLMLMFGAPTWNQTKVTTVPESCIITIRQEHISIYWYLGRESNSPETAV